MPADRSQWASSFRDKLPPWQCPVCKKGHLFPIKDKLWMEETGPSKSYHNHDAWEPEWIQKRFACFLECNFPDCKEIAVASGSSGINYYQIGWDEDVSEDIFTVESVVPAPIPIQYPEDTPENIVGAIGQASALIWLSAEAAANAIRQSVEHLMDEAGIAAKNGTGKRVMLHNRILDFQKTDQENGDVLLATKWLGNTGSHVGGIIRDHVLDAFDMIELVLNSRYGARKTLMAKVAAVNAAKGPV